MTGACGQAALFPLARLFHWKSLCQLLAFSDGELKSVTLFQG